MQYLTNTTTVFNNRAFLFSDRKNVAVVTHKVIVSLGRTFKMPSMLCLLAKKSLSSTLSRSKLRYIRQKQFRLIRIDCELRIRLSKTDHCDMEAYSDLDLI